MNAILEASTSGVLETMFFTAAEPAGAGSQVVPFGSEWLCVSVAFNGSPSGEARVWLSLDAAAALAANFLGLDQPAGTAEAEQTACELANMICGSIVSRIESDVKFDLAGPRIVGPAEPWTGKPPAYFNLDTGTLAVACSLEC